MKFKMGGSGGEGAGAGWIGKQYFSQKDEIYETDDPVMIDLLKKSNMAIEIVCIETIQESIEIPKPKTKRR